MVHNTVLQAIPHLEEVNTLNYAPKPSGAKTHGRCAKCGGGLLRYKEATPTTMTQNWCERHGPTPLRFKGGRDQAAGDAQVG